MAPRILVLGAGVNGLSSAVCIQQACPNAQVQIVAETFTPETTSDGSAGFWEPFFMGEGDVERTLKLCAITFEYLMGLAHSQLASVVRAQKLSGYHLFKNSPREIPNWSHIVQAFRELTGEDLKRLPDSVTGNFYTSVSIDVPAYMAWLMDRFKAQGGTFKCAKVEAIDEIATECDILVNCSALSAKYLFNDDSVYPIRGQVWKVEAPWVKHFYIVQEPDKNPIYILPGVDYATVGGSGDVGDWNTSSDTKLGAEIWNRATAELPWLKGMTPKASWAGLRPGRPALRLEADTVSTHGRNLKVVHNYGHGGSGITMHWGCALEVAKIVMQSLGTPIEDANRIISRL